MAKASGQGARGAEDPRCRVTRPLSAPERLRPAGTFLLFRRRLLAEPAVHRLLRARDQGPLAGADRVLLPDREEVLPAVGQHRAWGPHPAGQAFVLATNPNRESGSSNLPPAETARPAALTLRAHLLAPDSQQHWQPSAQHGSQGCPHITGRGGSHVPATGEHAPRGAPPRTGGLKPHQATSGRDEDRRLEAAEWLRAPGEEGGKLHPRAGRHHGQRSALPRARALGSNTNSRAVPTPVTRGLCNPCAHLRK